MEAQTQPQKEQEISGKEILQKNKKRICEALREAGISKVVATYAGYGDSGGFDEVDYYDGNDQKNPPTTEIEYIEASYVWRANGRVSSVKHVKKSLDDAVLDFCYDAIDVAGHGGYENGDGGGGTITIHVASQKVEVDHYDYYTETIDSHDEL